MVYPTQAQLLDAEPLLEWIDQHVLRSDPFAFKGVGFRPVISLVSRELGVEANGVYCIGSGAVGLSMNPNKVLGADLKQFNDSSDLDIALISELHFETAWRDLRQAVAPTLTEIHPLIVEHLKWQRKRFFDGAILAQKLLPTFSFGNTWIPSAVRLRELVSTLLDREVEMNLWIYRDYWSLRSYVASSIIRCRQKVI